MMERIEAHRSGSPGAQLGPCRCSRVRSSLPLAPGVRSCATGHDQAISRLPALPLDGDRGRVEGGLALAPGASPLGPEDGHLQEDVHDGPARGTGPGPPRPWPDRERRPRPGQDTGPRLAAASEAVTCSRWVRIGGRPRRRAGGRRSRRPRTVGPARPAAARSPASLGVEGGDVGRSGPGPAAPAASGCESRSTTTTCSRSRSSSTAFRTDVAGRTGVGGDSADLPRTATPPERTDRLAADPAEGQAGQQPAPSPAGGRCCGPGPRARRLRPSRCRIV